MINFVIGGIVIFLVYRGIKSYFSNKGSCCGGSCCNCHAACNSRKD